MIFNFADLLSRKLVDRTWEQQLMELSAKLRALNFYHPRNAHVLLLYFY